MGILSQERISMTTENTDLTSLQSLLANNEEQETALAEIKTMKAFLPRIQLMQAGSTQVAEDKAKRGEFLLFFRSDKFSNLGTEFPVVPIQFRFKAMEFGKETRAYYDIKSPKWAELTQKIADMGMDAGAIMGPEFLVWLPEVDNGIFATYHLTSQTAQAQSKPLLALKMQSSILKSEVAKNKKGQTWVVPVVQPASESCIMPSDNQLIYELKDFKSAKDSVVEDAEPASANSERAR